MNRREVSNSLPKPGKWHANKRVGVFTILHVRHVVPRNQVHVVARPPARTLTFPPATPVWQSGPLALAWRHPGQCLPGPADPGSHAQVRNGAAAMLLWKCCPSSLGLQTYTKAVLCAALPWLAVRSHPSPCPP